MCSTYRSSCRITAIRLLSGDQRRLGRTGMGRCSWLGRGMVTPYALKSTPSVVSCTESLLVARLRTHTLFLYTNASSFLSGEATYGVGLGSVSLTAQVYATMLHTKRLRTAVNSISFSFASSWPNLND